MRRRYTAIHKFNETHRKSIKEPYRQYATNWAIDWIVIRKLPRKRGRPAKKAIFKISHQFHRKSDRYPLLPLDLENARRDGYMNCLVQNVAVLQPEGRMWEGRAIAPMKIVALGLNIYRVFSMELPFLKDNSLHFEIQDGAWNAIAAAYRFDEMLRVISGIID
jgi:hypothetical protein